MTDGDANPKNLDPNTEIDYKIATDEIDVIFAQARSELWDFKKFSEKILVGAAKREQGYLAIAIDLIFLATGFRGDRNYSLLYYFVSGVNELNSKVIGKAHQTFQQGLEIRQVQQNFAETMKF